MDRFLWLPAVASEHGPKIDQVNYIVHAIMFLLFIGWISFFFYAILRFRQSKSPRANYASVKSRASTMLEIVIAVVEVILLAGFSIPLWSERVDNFPPESESTVVRVVAQQFGWNIHYPGADKIFGETDPELVDEESNKIGLNRKSQGGEDDIVTWNQLHLPVNKPAIIKLSSKDVIHCIALIEMRIKQDAVPGMQIPLWFTPTISTEKMRQLKANPEYNYEIACAQLCGVGHATMKGYMTIHTQDKFDAWLEEQIKLLEESEDEDW